MEADFVGWGLGHRIFQRKWQVDASNELQQGQRS